MMSNQTADMGLTATEIKEYNYWVGMRQALDRLEANPDFQKIILEGYFRDKAVNGVSLLASPLVKRNGSRGDVFESLIAISQLQDYFITIRDMGAEDTANDDEEDESVDEIEG